MYFNRMSGTFSVVKEGNPSGCHVVIVYDLVQSGGAWCKLCFTLSLWLAGYLWIRVSLHVRVQKTKKIVIITIIMLLLQKVLAAHGATKVSAYVTHAVFPKNSWKKFVHKNGGKPLPLTLFVSFYFTLHIHLQKKI
ncbi:putative ribose-phosphate diphosphokinase [Helianthus debilis subsp. tardiflorus]